MSSRFNQSLTGCALSSSRFRNHAMGITCNATSKSNTTSLMCQHCRHCHAMLSQQSAHAHVHMHVQHMSRSSSSSSSSSTSMASVRHMTRVLFSVVVIMFVCVESMQMLSKHAIIVNQERRKQQQQHESHNTMQHCLM